ncbi:integrator complex subunit 15-like [Uloborus diversus]|uniref:integrator complex subunit 15-like n=1 Tax=Uloborus diversus TaxID=327109 RepID=UPI00240A936F|nr:integrator complex subunit 15-like [Uloborus diversus]
MGDVKCYLRKMDFPSVLPKALEHIQKLWLPDCSSQQVGLMKELSEEFVFFEVDKWGNTRNQKLPPIKELQIVERIACYFQQPDNDQKMATFQFLFPFGSKILENRLPVLGKLLSLAIATENGNVLTYIGTWMQLCTCVSDYAAFIAKAVVREHIKPNCKSDRMKNLPSISPVFCASLISAITNMHLTTCPPDHIIKVILDWINTTPFLCFSPFKLSIPSSFNFPGPQTPIPGLMFWCILSPLYKEYSENTGKANSNEKTFSSLLLALLQCMTKSTSIRDPSWCEAVSATSIIVIAETLKKMSYLSKDRLDTSLDRFAMCVEVALTSSCLHIHPERLAKLFKHCLQLPYNQPLKIVLQKWSTVFSGR